ncbi:NAD(P)/FAD-dependent oxidoreductase [Desulfogranum japonicum]|uniref:NAD(P)/FAD-dependent oxidoreductase n=1 Tax=Desulfogranum japonicum TaxID=231447 RepID=UPI00048E7271|nr:FAD-dependent oxidoreductase [Desulfogranum japonicum]
MSTQKIAIIGSGISGLSCAYTLASQHDITVYEAAGYIGGHTHTVQVDKGGEITDVDTGFIVFNDRTYPHFIGLMEKLGVEYQPTEMSFSVRNDAADLEYNGNNLNSLFAQRRNVIRPAFIRMVADIVRFNKEVLAAAAKGEMQTIGEFLATNRYSTLFRENYLLPMVSAIWSMGLESCMDFPLDFFVRFFDNHGLLNITNRPQWYTIVGGSSSYIKPLTASFQDRIRLNSPVLRVERNENKVSVVTDRGSEEFDQVVFACHGPQALSLLSQPTQDEQNVLQEFTTSENTVILHTDISFLPKRRLAWASWNYNMVDAAQEQSTLTYHMNILQRLDTRHNYLVTLNQHVPEQHILGTYTYSHPVYTQGAIQAQQQWDRISGKNRTHFCGAYWFNGFHEDGVRSGLRVAAALEDS